MFGIIGKLGPWELALILVIVLVIIGPGKLPDVGKSVGKAIQNFKKAREEDDQIPEPEKKPE